MNEQSGHLTPLLAALPDRHVPPRRSRPAPVDGFRRMLATLRRRWLAFAAVFVFVLAGVLVYTLRQTPEYTATASLLVNSRVLNVVPRQNDVVPQASDEDRAVSAEVQVLQSNEVAQRVIAALQAGPRPRLAQELTEAEAPSPAAVLGALKQRTRIERPGATNVLAVSFISPDPALAAEVANAYVAQYLGFKTDMRLTAARSADSSLRDELQQMRGRVEEAEAAVAQYRQANNLLSADGITLTEQEQSLYKQQEAAAQTSLAEERARLTTARSQLARGSLGDDVGEALNSPVIAQMRGQRAEASAKLAQLETRYKPAHPEVARARRELADIDKGIETEIARVISNLEARVQVAQQKSGVASGIASQSRAELAANSAASVRLNELERRAEALRTNYAGLLQRQTAVASEAVVADIDARPLSAAMVPQQPSFPNKKLNLAIGALLALLIAGAVVALLQIFDQTLVSSRDVEEKLGLPHIVNIPAVRSIVPRHASKTVAVDFVLDEQLSLLAESVRGLLLDIEKDGSSRTRVVGLTSARPEEGKSTLAVCLARVAAASGRKTLLIDGDIRRPSIAGLFGLSPRIGLTEVLSGRATLKEALLQDERTGAFILPSVPHRFDQAEVSSHEALDTLLSQLHAFDLVIIDSAPALAAVESRLLMEHVDHALMVVRWHSTRVPTVRAALKRLHSIGVRPAGVVMTRVDMKAIAAYALDDVDHDYRSYAHYGA